MTLSDLAALGSFISGVAVPTSLVFLYFQLRQVNQQVRQAENNQQALVKQARTSRLMEINARLMEPSFAEVNLKIGLNSADLTSSEVFRFMAHARLIFQNGEETFSQNRRGLLSEYDFRGFKISIKAGLQLVGLRVAWKRSRVFFEPEYIEFIDGLLKETPIVPLRPDSILAQWKAETSDELSSAAA